MNKALPILLVVTMLLTSCKKDNEESVKWIDLGLPSGLLWADRNLGATTPEEYGDEFPWGETTGRHATWWEWDNYLYGSSSNSLTKYCNNPEYGLNGFTDNRTQLESCDDAATVLLGSGSHTPTKDDWQELIDNTTYTVSGRGAYFTAANGKSIYLPYGHFFMMANICPVPFTRRTQVVHTTFLKEVMIPGLIIVLYAYRSGNAALVFPYVLCALQDNRNKTI